MTFKTLFVSLLLVILTGCSSLYKYDVQVSPSKEILKAYGNFPSIEVDVAGVSEEEAHLLSSYPLDKYFAPNNSMRRHIAPVTLHFSDLDWQPKIIEGGSAEFKKWKERGATHIVALVNLPFTDEENKSLDPRIYILKIKDGTFSTQDDIYIKIGSTGLSKTTKVAAEEDLPGTTTTDDIPKEMKLKCTSKHGQAFMECKEAQLIP